jgi:hypothetical protein
VGKSYEPRKSRKEEPDRRAGRSYEPRKNRKEEPDRRAGGSYEPRKNRKEEPERRAGEFISRGRTPACSPLPTLYPGLLRQLIHLPSRLITGLFTFNRSLYRLIHLYPLFFPAYYGSLFTFPPAYYRLIPLYPLSLPAYYRVVYFYLFYFPGRRAGRIYKPRKNPGLF